MVQVSSAGGEAQQFGGKLNALVMRQETMRRIEKAFIKLGKARSLSVIRDVNFPSLRILLVGPRCLGT
jgi:hypothetical protein